MEWYGGVGTASPRKVLLEPLSGGPGWSQTVELVGIADYDNSNLPVVIKLETGTNSDYFIGFNRAIGKYFPICSKSLQHNFLCLIYLISILSRFVLRCQLSKR